MKITQVVAALIWREDKILICRRPANKARALLWEFPGGKVEAGETKEQALVRECREELGITVVPGSVYYEVKEAVRELLDLKFKILPALEDVACGKKRRRKSGKDGES